MYPPGPRLLSLAFATALSVPAQGQESMFRGGPSHTGAYPGAGITAFGGLQWHVQTGGPVRSSPTIAGNTLYIGSSDGFLYAIDATTGDLRWRRDLASAIMSTPAVATGAGLVVVGTYDGSFHALLTADGQAAWTFKTGRALPLTWGLESGESYTSSPTIVAGAALFGALDGNVYSVDLRSGHERWRYSLGARVYDSPAVAGTLLFVGGQNGTVHAINLATGRRKWRFDTEGTKLKSADFGFDRTTVQSSPAVVNGTVFVGARDGFLYAIDANSGAEKWRVDHKVSWINSSPAVSDGAIYVGSSDAHFIQAVDAATGQERWRTAVTGIVWASAAVDDALVYTGEGDGTMHALDKKTGATVWRYRVGQRIMSSAVVHAGRLYFASDDGGVYAVNAAARDPLHRAVFFDSTQTQLPLTFASATLRNYLVNRGYELLDATGLARFLGDRLRDGAPSVVVFSLARIPETVAPLPTDTVLLRRYLNAGGKVVWIGGPPMMAPREMKSLKDLARDAPHRLIGVRYDGGNFDPVGVARLTRDGLRLGLPTSWIDSWGADPSSVTTVYAYDEQGQAAAWLKSFGGPPGTGFIRLPMGDGSAGKPLLGSTIQAVAELFPRQFNP